MLKLKKEGDKLMYYICGIVITVLFCSVILFCNSCTSVDSVYLEKKINKDQQNVYSIHIHYNQLVIFNPEGGFLGNKKLLKSIYLPLTWSPGNTVTKFYYSNNVKQNKYLSGSIYIPKDCSFVEINMKEFENKTWRNCSYNGKYKLNKL